jgi:RNA polymerase subunit RPABC4/transcription elongation factor Spt4
MHYCPQCNSPFDKGEKVCSNCSYNLEQEFIRDPICPQCGTLYIAGTKRCKFDDALLIEYKDFTVKCVRCGAVYPPETKLCPIDGSSVRPRPGGRNKFPKREKNTGANPKSLKDQLLEYVPILKQIKGAEFIETPERVSMAIPAAEGADYSFTIIYDTIAWSTIWTYSIGDSRNPYLWNQVFERDEYLTDDDVFEDMDENIPRLLQNPTKIVQKRGLINWRFIMYVRQDDAWAETSRVIHLGWFGAPKIKGKMKEYFSPKVI